MSKQAKNIMANLNKGESPGPIGKSLLVSLLSDKICGWNHAESHVLMPLTVPQWFHNTCASFRNATEPPAKKICARRSLQFSSPVKDRRSSKSENNDPEPNFLDLGMRPIENGSVNSTSFEISQTTSHRGNTDDMPANLDDLYFDDQMNAEMIDCSPNIATDNIESSEGENRAQLQVSQQSEDSLHEEAFQAEENAEEQFVLEATPVGLVTPNTAGIADSPQQPGKKRVPCPARWKANMRKKTFNTGKSHISSTGKERKARELGPGCTEKCNRCKTRLTLERREEIRKAFWDIGNHQRQLDYVCSRTKSNTPKKKYAEPRKNGKEVTKTYFFQVNGKDVRVCKKTFMDTLSICDSWLKTSTENSRGESGIAPPDMRGKHTKSTISRKNKDLNDSVREHINLIPRIESHYTRSKTKREYLENGLSIEELYRRYLIWVAEKNLPVVASARQYRKIFNEEFNIGFFMPKSDQCALCSRWKHATTEEKSKMARQFALHTENRNISRNLKASDKLNSEKEENFGKLCVASFDMQKILTCPKSEVADFLLQK
ncbi:Ribosomal RNA large subunit methyltransferase H [Frankliniella fusca]|uniref:Ribosomal RNA large subunit methyltransferase H n=1 Tax=Frankliniella fusca TaxID=407009 RepID=A0AAE1LBU1_9NEOP|nr:Ribosomal RNA large subunit methyltransferase H [Frankliniella fusca]